MIRFLAAIILASQTLAYAEDTLWTGNKLTSKQPFPGRVLAVESSWGGYRLVIESIGESEKSYCIAQIWPAGFPQLDYKIIDKSNLPTPGVSMIYLNPAVEVEHFSWSMGAWKIGRNFGENDSLKKVVDAVLIGENQGDEKDITKQPATHTKSKSEGKQKPQPEAERPSR